MSQLCLFKVSERERQVNLDSKFLEIVQMVAEKTVNPQTHRPYPVTTIEQSLRDAHFAIKANRNAKQLALEAIRLLKGYFFVKIQTLPSLRYTKGIPLFRPYSIYIEREINLWYGFCYVPIFCPNQVLP